MTHDTLYWNVSKPERGAYEPQHSEALVGTPYYQPSFFVDFDYFFFFFADCWLLCWITRRWIDICFQPWCNPLWMTGLKAPTKQLAKLLPVFFTRKVHRCERYLVLNKHFASYLSETEFHLVVLTANFATPFNWQLSLGDRMWGWLWEVRGTWLGI